MSDLKIYSGTIIDIVSITANYRVALHVILTLCCVKPLSKLEKLLG